MPATQTADTIHFVEVDTTPHHSFICRECGEALAADHIWVRARRHVAHTHPGSQPVLRPLAAVAA